MRPPENPASDIQHPPGCVDLDKAAKHLRGRIAGMRRISDLGLKKLSPDPLQTLRPKRINPPEISLGHTQIGVQSLMLRRRLARLLLLLPERLAPFGSGAQAHQQRPEILHLVV